MKLLQHIPGQFPRVSLQHSRKTLRENHHHSAALRKQCVNMPQYNIDIMVGSMRYADHGHASYYMYDFLPPVAYFCAKTP